MSTQITDSQRRKRSRSMAEVQQSAAYLRYVGLYLQQCELATNLQLLDKALGVLKPLGLQSPQCIRMMADLQQVRDSLSYWAWSVDYEMTAVKNN